jgi:hypothetical protein
MKTTDIITGYQVENQNRNFPNVGCSVPTLIGFTYVGFIVVSLLTLMSQVKVNCSRVIPERQLVRILKLGARTGVYVIIYFVSTQYFSYYRD